MIADVTQRWRRHRAEYRPAGEPIDTRRYEVARIDRAQAKRFVLKHHYARSFPAERRSFGLFRGEQLAGVAVYSQPMHSGVLSCCPDPDAGIELGRLVLLDEVPANGESWFVARTFELLRRESVSGVVSFSDDQERCASDGRVVFAGHVGTVYQASNAVYLGRGSPRTLRMLSDGRILSARSASKVRNGERSRDHVVRLLEEAGAEPLGPSECPREWITRWSERLTRRSRHPGNHKYVWALRRGDRKHLPEGKDYPKWSGVKLGPLFNTHRRTP